MFELINCERLKDVCNQNLNSLDGRTCIFSFIIFLLIDLSDLKLINPNLGLYLEQLLKITFFNTLLVKVVNLNHRIDCHSDIQFLIEEIKAFQVHDRTFLDFQAAIQLLHVKNAVFVDERVCPYLRAAIKVV